MGRTRDLALAALGAFCFGLTIVFNRAAARDGLGAATTLSIRFAIAGLLLLALLRVLGRPLLPPRGERLRVALLGCGLYAAEATFFFMALERGTAAAVALLFYTYPAVVTVVEVALGRMRLRAVMIVALALAVGGGAVVAAGGGRVSITTTGILFTLGSVCTFSTYVIASDRLLVRTPALTAAAWTTLGGGVVILCLGVVQATLVRPGAKELALLTGNAVATAAAFTLFFVVLGRLGPSRTAIVMAMEVVAGVVLAAVLLDESVQPVVAAGGAAVMAGALLAAAVSPRSVEQLESASTP
ncbi:MAG: DMT family transporter [Acidimicrobiia bacterium]|nr:DMT family transporter [Acidimicrobiia bacterium]